MDDSAFGFHVIKQYLEYFYRNLIYDEDIPRPESPQMRADWASLPLLALKHVLGYLSRQDALAAMSTCRHWRSALLMYEDSKAVLKLRVNNIERSLFVTRMFRRRTNKLVVFVNSYDETQLEEFMNVVVSLFYDTKLQELVFVGDSYLHQNPQAVEPELPRAIVESAILHMRSLKKIALMGCSLSSAKNKQLYIMNNDMTKIQRIRKFNNDPSPGDTVLSRCNMDLMQYSKIQTMILDYEYITTEALQTLSCLKMFHYLTMVVRDRPHLELQQVDWLRLQTVYDSPLCVTVCLLQLPNDKIEEVMDNVFVQGLKLVSFKALLCNTMHMEAIIQVSKMFKNTLQEFVWTDAPHEATKTSEQMIKSVRTPELNMFNVNPLVMMCWQCAKLKRFVVHGYWIWHYDVLGMCRLRRGIQLELSAVFTGRGGRGACRGGVGGVGGIERVLARDKERWRREQCALLQMTESEESPNWLVPWSHLHPGLQAGATSEQRADYIMMETRVVYTARK